MHRDFHSNEDHLAPPSQTNVFLSLQSRVTKVGMRQATIYIISILYIPQPYPASCHPRTIYLEGLIKNALAQELLSSGLHAATSTLLDAFYVHGKCMDTKVVGWYLRYNSEFRYRPGICIVDTYPDHETKHSIKTCVFTCATKEIVLCRGLCRSCQKEGIASPS